MVAKKSLLEEIGQQRPFRSDSQEAVLALMHTADLYRRYFTAVVGVQQLTLQQYNVLRILRGAGEEGLPTLTIGNRMVEKTPGITRLIDRLEAKELVERWRCPKDRRRVWCRISRSGLATLSQLDPAVNQADDDSMTMLSVAEQRQLIEVLERIRSGLG
ncbi:MAG: MarR family transcriptional regulator [Deltaproteobacteria bacterium]|nr:MarR family transcriptional regulator [Deltaproteobacteria bacterium]